MSSKKQFTRSLEKDDRLKADFISSELALAITFCENARFATDQFTAERNAQNARRAQAAACHALEGSLLRPSVREAIDEEVADLAERLRELDGESRNKSAARHHI